MSETRPLNLRERIFCAEYVLLGGMGEGAAAARAAGYSEKTAKVMAGELIRRPKVAARIEQLVEAREKRTLVTADYVVNKLRGVAERCTAPETFDASGANRALELLGRHVGAFKSEIEVRGSGSGVGGVPQVFTLEFTH